MFTDEEVAAIRAEIIRQRAFIRAAETQGTKIVTMIDAGGSATEPPPVDPPPTEPPPTEPPPTEPPVQGTWVHRWSQFADTTALFAAPRSLLQFPIWANTGGYVSLGKEGDKTFLNTHWGGGPYGGGIDDEQIGVDVLISQAFQATEVWIEIPLRYSANFRVGSDHKTMFVFEEDGTRWEMRFGAFSNRAQAKIDNGNVQVATDAQGRELDITNPVLVWDGLWHVLRLHLKTGSGSLFQCWLDGRKLIDASGFNAGPPSPFNRVALSRNGDPVEEADLDWGDVKVHTTNPGW